MCLKIIPAYHYLYETNILFSEYTEMLILIETMTASAQT